MTAGPAASVRLLIHGRVQGVFFRDWTVAAARRLGLSGWVRNRRDGSVELSATGPADLVEAFVGLCAKGPPSAQVERVERFDDAEPVGGDFVRRPTA